MKIEAKKWIEGKSIPPLVNENDVFIWLQTDPIWKKKEAKITFTENGSHKVQIYVPMISQIIPTIRGNHFCIPTVNGRKVKRIYVSLLLKVYYQLLFV